MADLLQRDDKEKSQNAEWETEKTLGALLEMGNQQRGNLGMRSDFNFGNICGQ